MIPTGIYSTNSLGDAERLDRAADRAGLQFVVLDGTRIFSDFDFFAEVERAFGIRSSKRIANWDDMQDYFEELNWQLTKGYVVVFNDYELFHRAAEASFFVALDLLQTTTDSLGAKEVPVIIVLADPEGPLSGVEPLPSSF
jgi:hypothetical protein